MYVDISRLNHKLKEELNGEDIITWIKQEKIECPGNVWTGQDRKGSNNKSNIIMGYRH